MRVVRQPDITQFFTTEHVNLICFSSVDSAVDTPISVDLVWSGPSGRIIQSDGRVSVLDAQGMLLDYNSTLQISSLQSSDSGTYTCTSVASSEPASRFVVASDSVSATSTLNAGDYMYDR